MAILSIDRTAFRSADFATIFVVTLGGGKSPKYFLTELQFMADLISTGTAGAWMAYAFAKKGD